MFILDRRYALRLKQNTTINKGITEGYHWEQSCWVAPLSLIWPGKSLLCNCDTCTDWCTEDIPLSWPTSTTHGPHTRSVLRRGAFLHTKCMAYASNRISFLLRCGSDEANGEAWQAGKIKGKYRGISYMEAKTARGRFVPTKRLSEPDCLQARISKYQHTHCRKSAYAHSSVCVFACVWVGVCVCLCVRVCVCVCVCLCVCVNQEEKIATGSR